MVRGFEGRAHLEGAPPPTSEDVWPFRRPELEGHPHAIWPRVETGSEVEHRVDADGQHSLDVLIDDVGAHDPRPGILCVHGHRRRDLLATFTRQPSRQRIAEQRVWSLCLLCPEHRRPARGVRDVANEWLGHGVASSEWRAASHYFSVESLFALNSDR